MIATAVNNRKAVFVMRVGGNMLRNVLDFENEAD
jgi:hypothetical protein